MINFAGEDIKYMPCYHPHINIFIFINLLIDKVLYKFYDFICLFYSKSGTKKLQTQPLVGSNH
jgi:hypothetical protein